MSKPVLGIILSNSWAIKNIVLTGALKMLQRDFSLLAWVPDPMMDEVQKIVAKQGIEEIRWRKYHTWTPSRMHQLAARGQQALLYERHQVSTEKVRQKSGIRRRSSAQKILLRALRPIAQSPLGNVAFNCFTNLRAGATPAGLYTDDFAAIVPDLVLSTHPVDRSEDAVYAEAQARGIPIITMVHSWDNLTSKGVIHQGFRRVMVWNEEMRGEVTRFYPRYQPENVLEIGIPRFDVYKMPLPPAFEREVFLAELGLDPARPVILFANTSTRIFKTQPQVIEHIRVAMTDGSLPAGVQLLIRCHPLEDISIYDGFRKHPDIAVWPEKSNSAAPLLTVPPADDLWGLAAMLRHSELCINAASTMALDAIACDKPVISVAYDGDEQLPYYDSIASAYEYSHQLAFMKYDAVELCRQREELISAINAVLDGTEDRREQRLRVRKEFLSCEESSLDRFTAALRGALERP